MRHTTRSAASLELAGTGLTIRDADDVLHGRVEHLKLSSAARKEVAESRRSLERLQATGETIYGLNTGFGKLANQRIDADEVLALQENLLRSHAVGMGPLLSVGVSRLALV